VVLVAALLRRDIPLVRTAAVAGLVFAVPHLAYHAGHLKGFSDSDGTMEVIALAIAALAPAVALLTTFSRRSSNIAPVVAPTSSAGSTPG
jgi:membrane protease YdiL (CAAX protease family)